MPINLPDLNLGLKQVNTGMTANDGQGDDLRTAFDKFNLNMAVLAGNVNDSLSSSRDYYVSSAGADTNNGLSITTAFRTITKAINVIYSSVNLRGQQVTVNLMPGEYLESVVINGNPLGDYGSEPALRIRKAPGQAGIVYWSLDPLVQKGLITIGCGARVSLDSIHFRGLSTNTPDVQFIESKDSFLVLGACDFNLLSTATNNNTCHIRLKKSELQLTKPYTLLGGATNHIIADKLSYVWSPTSTDDPKLCMVTGSVEFVEFISSKSSDIVLPDTSIRYQGNLQGRKFRSDIFSEIELGVSTLPVSTTAGIYDTQQFLASATFINPVSLAGGFTCGGPASFSNTTAFSGATTFSSTSTFVGSVNFQGVSTGITPDYLDNTNKHATTNFVQEVIQNKILDAVALATPSLFGLVKIDGIQADPVVYRKSAVDGLLITKADLASPTFTGEPRVPTAVANDSSTLIASTAHVKSVVNGIVSIPSGTIITYAGSTIPAGYLVCDGASYVRADYPSLFTALGTTWGSTSGTTFNVPDLRDRFPIGVSPTKALGSSGGSATVTLSVANLPPHTHNVIDPGHGHSYSDPGHGHSYSDPGHNHTVNDPGHNHFVNAFSATSATTNPIAMQAQFAQASLTGPINTNHSGTGIWLSGAYSYITILGSVTGISINQSGTGVTLQNTGSGTAVNVLNPYRAVSYCIKT